MTHTVQHRSPAYIIESVPYISPKAASKEESDTADDIAILLSACANLKNLHEKLSVLDKIMKNYLNQNRIQ